MSVTKLQATRDQVVSGGIGVYLPVVKTLIAAIDEHITEDNIAVTTQTVSTTQIASLQKQVALASVTNSQQQGLIHDLKAQITSLQNDIKVANENATSYLKQIEELSKAK